MPLERSRTEILFLRKELWVDRGGGKKKKSGGKKGGEGEGFFQESREKN